ncbi:hypothetical protein SLA2020_099710 [Shorea laevis]
MLQRHFCPYSLCSSASPISSFSPPLHLRRTLHLLGIYLLLGNSFYIIEMSVRTVKVNNIYLAVSERDIKEFFSFSGDIQYVEMQRETENTQLAFFTFKDSQGADTASLLTGATIAHLSVTITPVEDYQLPPEALPLIMETKLAETDSTVKKAEDMVSTMLAKGFVLGKDAINKAKVFDEQHQLTSNASATVASIDRWV